VGMRQNLHLLSAIIKEVYVVLINKTLPRNKPSFFSFVWGRDRAGGNEFV